MGHIPRSAVSQDALRSNAYAHKPDSEPNQNYAQETDNILVKHYETQRYPSAKPNGSSIAHSEQQPMAASLGDTVTPYEALVLQGNGTASSVTAMRTTAVLEPATGGSKQFSSLYANYDPMTGVRTAAMLGSMLLILILYIGYKAKCSKSSDEETWTEEDDKWCQKYQEKYEEKLSLRERQSSINPSEAPLEKEPSIDKTRNWIASQPLCSDLAEGDKRLLDSKMKLSMQSRQSSVSMEDLTSLSRSHDIQVIISCDTDDSRAPLRPHDTDVMSRRRYKKSHSMDTHSLAVKHKPVKSHSMDTSMYNDEEILEMQRLNLPRVWITDMDAIDTHKPRRHSSSRPRPKLRRQSSAKSDSGNLIDLEYEPPQHTYGGGRSPLQRAVSSPSEEVYNNPRPLNISLPNIQLFPPSPCDTPPTCLLMGSQPLPNSRPHRPLSLDVPDAEKAKPKHRRRLKSLDVPRGRSRPRSPSRQYSLEVGGMQGLSGSPQRQHSLEVPGQERPRSPSRQMSLEVPGQGQQRSPNRQKSLEVPGQSYMRSPNRQMSLEVPGQGQQRSPSRQMSLEVPGQSQMRSPSQLRSPSRQMSLEVPGQGQQRSPNRQMSLEVPGQGRRRSSSRQMSLEVPGQTLLRTSSHELPCESHYLPPPHSNPQSLAVPGQGRRPSRPRSLSRQRSMDVSGEVAASPHSRQQSLDVPGAPVRPRSPHRQNSTPGHLPVTPSYGEGAGHKTAHERSRASGSHKEKHGRRSPKMQVKTRSAEEKRTSQQQAAAPCYHSTPCLRQSLSPHHSPHPSPHLAPPPRECPSPQPVAPGVSLALQDCPSRSHQKAAQNAYKLSPQTANYIRLAQPDPARHQISDPGLRRDNSMEHTSAAQQKRKDGWTDRRKHHSDPNAPIESRRFLTPNTLQVPTETYNLPVSSNLLASPTESLSPSSHSIYSTPLTTPEKPIPLAEFTNFTKQMNELTDKAAPDVSPTIINTISRV